MPFSNCSALQKQKKKKNFPWSFQKYFSGRFKNILLELWKLALVQIYHSRSDGTDIIFFNYSIRNPRIRQKDVNNFSGNTKLCIIKLSSFTFLLALFEACYQQHIIILFQN